MLALLLIGFGGFDPVPRQDSAVFVLSLLSAVMSEQLNMLEAPFFSSALCKVS